MEFAETNSLDSSNPIVVRKNNQPNNHIGQPHEPTIEQPSRSLSDESENYYQAFENEDDDEEEFDDNDDGENNDNDNEQQEEGKESKNGIINENNNQKNDNENNNNEDEDKEKALLELAIELSKQINFTPTSPNSESNTTNNIVEETKIVVENTPKYCTLIDEPSPDEPNTTKISFRLLFTPSTPTSSNIRRFHLDSSVEQCYSYIYSLLPSTDKEKKFDLLTPFPRESISSKIHMTIQEAGLNGSQLVMKWE